MQRAVVDESEIDDRQNRHRYAINDSCFSGYRAKNKRERRLYVGESLYSWIIFHSEIKDGSSHSLTEYRSVGITAKGELDRLTAQTVAQDQRRYL